MGIELTGRIHTVFETKQVSERFSKREFVLETERESRYPQTILFQATGDRCAQLDGLKPGDDVRVEFSIRGREWRSPAGETKYFNSLDVWKVERVGASRATPTSMQSSSGSSDASPTQPPLGDEDIPFSTCDLAYEPSPIARCLR